jgi:hypothetical protein
MLLAAGVVAPYDVAVLAAGNRGPFGGTGHSFDLFTAVNGAHLLVIIPLIAAFHARAVVVISEGHRPDLPRVAAYGLRVLPVVIAAQVVSWVGIGLAAIFLVIPGILLGLRWCVVALAVAIENEGLFGAMGRSGRLAAGHYWHIFALTIAVEGIVIAAAFGVHAIPVGGNSSAAMVALEVAVQVAVACYVALTLTVLYFDLCARYSNIESENA